MNRQTTKWEEIFANYAYDKRPILILKTAIIYISQLNCKIKQFDKTQNRWFFVKQDMGTVEYTNEKRPLWSESSVPRKAHTLYPWSPPDELWGSDWIWELWPNQCIIHWWIHDMMAFTGKPHLAGGSEELDRDSDLSVSGCFLAIIRQPVCSAHGHTMIFCFPEAERRRTQLTVDWMHIMSQTTFFKLSFLSVILSR